MPDCYSAIHSAIVIANMLANVGDHRRKLCECRMDIHFLNTSLLRRSISSGFPSALRLFPPEKKRACSLPRSPEALRKPMQDSREGTRHNAACCPIPGSCIRNFSGFGRANNATTLKSKNYLWRIIAKPVWACNYPPDDFPDLCVPSREKWK